MGVQRYQDHLVNMNSETPPFEFQSSICPTRDDESARSKLIQGGTYGEAIDGYGHHLERAHQPWLGNDLAP